MVESIAISRIHEQRLLHSLYVGPQEGVPDDQKMRAEKLGLPEEENTRKMAGIMFTLLTGNEAEQEVAKNALVLKFRETAPSEIGKPGTSDRRKPESVMDVADELERLAEIIEAKDSKGETISNGLKQQYIDCQTTLFCIDGAATLAVQALMNAKDGTSGRPEAEVAILDKDNGHITIEQLLSGEEDGGVLCGVGRRVAENVISDRGLIGAMTVMSTMVDGEGKIVAKKATPENLLPIETAIDEAYSNANLGQERLRDQAAMVQNYLAYVMDDAGLTETHPAQTGAEPPVTSPVENRSVQGLDPLATNLFASAGLTNPDADPLKVAAFMQLNEMMRSGEMLSSTNLFDVENWSLKVFDEAVKNQFFFNGLGWQQIGPMLENQIRTTFKGKSAAEVNKALDLMRSIASLYCQETAIEHADGDPTKYISFLPIAGVVTNYLWSQEAGNSPRRVEKRDRGVLVLDAAGQPVKEWVAGEGILGNPVVDQIRRQIVREAYDPRTGLSVLKHLKGKKNDPQASIDEWSDLLTKRITNPEYPEVMRAYQNRMNEMAQARYGVDAVDLKPEHVRSMVRAAISLFIVEDYPDLVVYSAQKAKEPDGKTVVPWMFFTADEAKKQNEDPINKDYGQVVQEGDCRLYARRKLRELAGGKHDPAAGEDINGFGVVEIWNSQFGNLTDIQHILLSIRRPVDLYRVKGGWDERILSVAETALTTLAEQKWHPNKDKPFPKLSEIGAKDITRWSNMVGAWFGNTKAGDLDDWKKFMDGADSLADLLQFRADKSDLGGFVSGEIFWCKVMASFSNRPDEFIANLARTLQIDEMATPKEIQEAQGAVLGSTGLGQNGLLAELGGRLSFKYGTEHYLEAVAMLKTDSSNPDRARSLQKVKQAATAAVSAGRVFNAVFGSSAPPKKKGR